MYKDAKIFLTILVFTFLGFSAGYIDEPGFQWWMAVHGGFTGLFIAIAVSKLAEELET